MEAKSEVKLLLVDEFSDVVEGFENGFGVVRFEDVTGAATVLHDDPEASESHPPCNSV